MNPTLLSPPRRRTGTTWGRPRTTRLVRSPAARQRVPSNVCPSCRGEFFASLADPGGTIELLCTGCVAFAPAADAPAPRDRGADLPAPVRFLRPSERLVFRIVRDHGPLWPADVLERIERFTGEFAGRSTVNHALKRLKRAGFVSSARPNGWSVCPTIAVGSTGRASEELGREIPRAELADAPSLAPADPACTP